MMRCQRSLLSVGFLCYAVAACYDAGSERGAQARSVVQVSDSAGVKDIFLGRVEELAAPELEADLFFFHAGTRDRVVRGRGRHPAWKRGLAVANRGASEVLIFSADGSLATRVGGQGEGPGEFSRLTTLLATDGALLAYDLRLARLGEFSETGDSSCRRDSARRTRA